MIHLRGWRSRVGDLIEVVWLNKNLSRAPIYRYVREKEGGTVSSSSRFQTLLVQRYSANLSIEGDRRPPPRSKSGWFSARRSAPSVGVGEGAVGRDEINPWPQYPVRTRDVTQMPCLETVVPNCDTYNKRPGVPPPCVKPRLMRLFGPFAWLLTKAHVSSCALLTIDSYTQGSIFLWPQVQGQPRVLQPWQDGPGYAHQGREKGSAGVGRSL